MKMAFFAAAALLACSSDPELEPRPTSCDPITQRFGTYRQTITPVSGNCVDEQTSVVRLSSGLDDGCEYIEPDDWSEGDCTVARSVRCVRSNGYTVTSVGVSTQQDARGDVITGLVTVTVYTPGGSAECYGTANVRWERL